jgi:hypothetical protein
VAAPTSPTPADLPDPGQPRTPPNGPRRPAAADKRAILLAGTVVVALVLAVAVITVLPAFRDRDTNNLGDDVFDVSASTVRARTPMLLNDLAGGDRAIWLTHVGDDETAGYHAFAAVTDAGCAITVNRDSLQLQNSCDGTVVPPDGGGLPQFPVTYDDGRLLVDLNFAERQGD